ncbi:MAG: DNA-processing protein DprA [Pseudomonadota bacterium]
MENLPERLALIRAPHLGPNTLRKLWEQNIEPLELLAASPNALADFGFDRATINAISSPDWETINQDIRIMKRLGIHLQWGVEDIPHLLWQIPGAPYWLFAKGRLSCLKLPTFAVVGSRNPTWLGRELAQEFAASLCGKNLCIASGLAEGIDAEAHQGALAVGGKTVAVCATGLDVVYPRKNANLAKRITDSGLLISEYPPGTVPTRHRFPQRNRIISGLSLGTLVVEAARRSGSLITARLAADQGREVFAVPGSVHNPLAKGCHRLIRQGAKLVEEVQDVLEELQQLAQIPFEHAEKSPDIEHNGEAHPHPKEWQELLDILSVAPISLDQLVRKSTLTQDRLCSMLLRMELAGMVASAPGGVFVRKTQ